jgi:hypothetical protein
MEIRVPAPHFTDKNRIMLGDRNSRNAHAQRARNYHWLKRTPRGSGSQWCKPAAFFGVYSLVHMEENNHRGRFAKSLCPRQRRVLSPDSLRFAGTFPQRNSGDCIDSNRDQQQVAHSKQQRKIFQQPARDST